MTHIELIVTVSRKLVYVFKLSLVENFFWRHYFLALSLTFISVMHFTTRRPCLRMSSYSAPSTSTENSKLSNTDGSPIRVADKSRSCRRIKNVFINDRGFPDQSGEFDVLLHDIDGGPVLRKLKHPPPPIGSVDPMFMFTYDEALHGKRLRKDLDLSHLEVTTAYALCPCSKKLVCLR
jgi:hypothetical protein